MLLLAYFQQIQVYAIASPKLKQVSTGGCVVVGWLPTPTPVIYECGSTWLPNSFICLTTTKMAASSSVNKICCVLLKMLLFYPFAGIGETFYYIFIITSYLLVEMLVP